MPRTSINGLDVTWASPSVAVLVASTHAGTIQFTHPARIWSAYDGSGHFLEAFDDMEDSARHVASVWIAEHPRGH